MEPRPHERGNRDCEARVVARVLASMEPRPHERGNTNEGEQVAVRFKLQWSHVLTNVETCYLCADSCSRDTASMEPRPHERGNAVRVSRIRLNDHGFNGATSSRTWKPLHPTGHRGSFFCFNGATSSRTWKPCCRCRSCLAAPFASMEPRPHERGNPTDGDWMRRDWECFNGATSSRTWKRMNQRWTCLS